MFGRAFGPLFDEMPAIIFDFKGDDLIEQLGAQEVSLTNPPPKEPGLYVVRPLPGDDDLISDYFRQIWQQEDIAVMVDEGTMIPQNDRWFRACLTQGRSKHIPLVICSQRPVRLDKYVFTEASYFAVFNLNNVEDRKFTKNYLNDRLPTKMPPYHFLYYDVGKDDAQFYSPVPDDKSIVAIYRKYVHNKMRRI